MLALYSVFECQRTTHFSTNRIFLNFWLFFLYTSCPTYDLMDETLRRLSHVFPNLCENGILLLRSCTFLLIIYLVGASFSFFFHKVLRRHFSISHQMTTIWAIHTNCHPLLLFLLTFKNISSICCSFKFKRRLSKYWEDFYNFGKKGPNFTNSPRSLKLIYGLCTI